MSRGLAVVAAVGLASVVACSGSSGGTSSAPLPGGPPSSPSVSPNATPPVDAGRVAPAPDAAGSRCPGAVVHLESQARANTQAVAMLRRMSLPQEITLLHGAGLNGGTTGTVGASAAIPSLGIPAVNQEDGPGGIGDVETGVTQLPAPIAVAATFDPATARCYGQVIGDEARGKGIELMYGPTINLVRVPEWGRAFESLGEDPLLAGTIGAAEVTGTQRVGVMAQVKHFAVYNQETNRNTSADDAIVAPRVLQEAYLRAWRDVMTADPASIMCSYSTINHQPACQDRLLINGYLNHQLGFKGFVGADYYATHSTVAAANAGLDQEQPASQYFGRRLLVAVRAGRVARHVVDTAATRILSQIYRFRLFTDYPTGTESSNVATTADAAVARSVAAQGTVLLKNSRGTLPLSGDGSIAVIGPAATGSTASSGGGTASVVSPGTVTPLAGIKAAAPAGTTVSFAAGLPSATQLTAIPDADLSPAYPSDGEGGAFTTTLRAPETGTYIFGLTSDLYFKPVSLSIDSRTLLNNPDSRPLRTYTASIHLIAGQHYKLAISGGSTDLRWAPPSVVTHQIAAAVAAATHADTAVVVVADPQESEAADRATLSLPSAQDDLVQAVAAANPHTVVVVEAGAAVLMPWLSGAASVVDQWYAGQTDGASLADVLFGSVDPSGHLPITFPASDHAVPAATVQQFPGTHGTVRYSEGLDVGYRWWNDTGHRPLFPFGYGLSYTTFHYSTPTVRVKATSPTPTVRVTVRVANTGDRAGADVAQVYLDSPAAGEPSRQLAGYQRVTIPAGATKRVTIQIGAGQLAAYVGAHWAIASGRYQAYVGDSSDLAQLQPPVPFTIARAYPLPADFR